jgi:hypothetical protein
VVSLDRTNQYQLQNNSYFGNNQYNFGPGSNYYPTLTDVINMENAAATGTRPATMPIMLWVSFSEPIFLPK